MVTEPTPRQRKETTENAFIWASPILVKSMYHVFPSIWVILRQTDDRLQPLDVKSGTAFSYTGKYASRDPAAGGRAGLLRTPFAAEWTRLRTHPPARGRRALGRR